MESEKLIANTVGDKTARACDNCITRRARWYCAADDAFLCQTCDGLIHSANLLARRHERVRLKAASITVLQVPSWHNGFTRKPRTPRQQKHQRQVNKSDKLTTNPLHVVPEMVQHNDNLFEQNEEQEELIYSVPIFDPFTVDHEEFAADIVENILRKGLDDEESFDMETLGFLDCPEMDNSVESSSTWGSTGKVIKFEAEEEMKDSRNVNYQIEAEIDMTRETFELNFDDYEEDDEKVGGVVGSVIDQLKEECEVMDINVEEKKNNILLALDYDGVLAAWPEQKSAWMTGDQPEVEHSSCWPDCMGECEKIHEKYPITYGEMGENRMLDGGREARVSRYREKRRSRLFSKKIRYEVRKLNAEKRPRIKGRFVKRANFVAVN